MVSYRYIERLFVKVIFVFGNHNGQNYNNAFSNKNDENVHILVNVNYKKKKKNRKQTNKLSFESKCGGRLLSAKTFYDVN